jgi:hypothetical protein
VSVLHCGLHAFVPAKALKAGVHIDRSVPCFASI